MYNGSTLIIGIAGGSGSGKTTLAQRIKNEFGDTVTLVKHDDYYRAHDELTREERKKLNYDYPGAFETDLLTEHLAALGRGETVVCPVYDYTEQNRSKETRVIEPTGVIVVEGILLLADPALRDKMDIRLYVDTDADVRLARRIRRDVEERGRTLDSVLNQYFGTVKPMHELYVEPSRKFADIIIPEGGMNVVAFEMIVERIKRHIEG